MKVGLVQVDGKIPNLALMKLARYHRQRGDQVDIIASSLFGHYDIVYMSKIFFSTPDVVPNFTATVVEKGGVGYDLTKTLPPEVENLVPDYELFHCDFAIGFTSRGCFRNCPFCVVPKKEGKLRPVGDLYSFWTGQRRVMLLDNNLNALPDHFELVVKQLIKEKVYVDFSQGLDLRIITPEQAQLLTKVRLWKTVHFAWDDVKDEHLIRRGAENLKKGGFNLSKATVYVLIGFNSTEEEDLYRVYTLRDMGFGVFVMPYNRNDPYQRHFARWVNTRKTFYTVDWKDYRRHGISNERIAKQEALNKVSSLFVEFDPKQCFV